jgi:6-methylsalicylate decarboxylase
MGWRTPAENLPWTPEISLRSMDALQVDIAILSLPPSSSGSIGPENRRSARRNNELVSSICRKYPDRFGFFASLPLLNDTEGESSLTSGAYIE